MVTLELNDIDAALFLEYRKHQNTFATLYNAGIFGIKNGKAVLSFGLDGTLMRIDGDVSLYQKGKPINHNIVMTIV